MRLDELFNNTPTPTDVTQGVEDVVRQLKAQCGDMIAAFKQSGKVLLRGIGDATGSRPGVIGATIRTDRRPSATPQGHHELMTKAMDDLGLPTKKNTIAASTQRKVAQEWGPVYILFVKDGWTGLTFEHGDFDDLFIRADVARGNVDSLKKSIEKMRPIVIKSVSELSDVLSDNHNEIIFSGVSYLALDVRNEQTADILKQLGLENISNIK